jgi:hypothetical protein
LRDLAQLVEIDNPDDAEVPPERHSDQPADRTPSEKPSGKIQPETRFRQEYSAELRAATGPEEQTEPAGPAEPGARSKAGEPAENEQPAKTRTSWEETAELGRWMWSEYKRRWPPEESPKVDRSDEPGSGRNRLLERSTNERIEAACDHVAEREEEKISPAMRDTESRDPDRHLVGFENRLKGRDRIKEKIFGTAKDFMRSPEQAVSLVSDAIRYTFQYEEVRYTQGVYADIARLKEQGFKLDKLKNAWPDDQYKGINSQWSDSGTGQRFEVQFHTRISFESKELTHPAYERLRTKQPDAFEQMVLEAFQTKFTAEVPVPPGAAEIPDYPRRGADAR